MATARNTIGTIFDTAGTSAIVVTGALKVVSAGVGLANAFVAKAQKDQQDQYAIDAETSVERMLEEAAYEQTETDLRITAYRAKSEQHAVSYENAYARFEAILRKPKLDSNIRGFRHTAK